MLCGSRDKEGNLWVQTARLHGLCPLCAVFGVGLLQFRLST